MYFQREYLMCVAVLLCHTLIVSVDNGRESLNLLLTNYNINPQTAVGDWSPLVTTPRHIGRHLPLS